MTTPTVGQTGRPSKIGELDPFEVIAGNISDAVSVSRTTEDGRSSIVWVNQSFEAMTGWASADIIGAAPGRLIGPDTDAAVLERIIDAMRRGEAAHERIVLHRHDGSPFPVEASYLVLPGDRPGYVGIYRDISGQVTAEAALLRTEQWAQAIVEHGDDVIIVTDGEGVVTYMGTSITHVLGIEATDLVGTPCFDLVHPDDLGRVLRDFGDEVRGTAKRTPTELRARHADGSWRHLSILATNLLDLPAVEGMVLTGRDVSRHHWVADLLSEQSEVLERVARAMPLEETLTSVVAMIEHRIPGAVCSIGQLDEGGGVTVKVAPSMPLALVDAIDRIPAASPLGMSLRAPGPTAVIYDDLATDFRWASTRHVFARLGLHACWAMRLTAPGTGALVGAIAVYLPEVGSPAPEELLLLERATHLASIAVERSDFEATLEHQALHDRLTGLPNRSLLLDRIEQALGRVRRLGVSLAVLFIDLDHFKVVNDSLGHAAGDRLLEQVAARFQRSLRAGDTVGRFGGDEFLLVCEDVEGEAGATAVAARLAVELEPPFDLDGTPVFVRASVGIAMALGQDPRADAHAAHRDDLAAEAELLVRNADAAMYRAKESGRARFAVFEEDLHRQVMKRLDLERELHRAVPADEIVLHYQPMVDLRSGLVVAVEALARWERPGHGLMPPAAFIPAAEDTGLIIEVGQRVLELACRQLVEWSDVAPHLRMTVNLSVRQLVDQRFLQRVHDVLDQPGVSPSRLCFEVTESALATGVGLVETLQRLCETGVGFAIDDFGTGYATLDYVRRFPMADHLKIDKSFVAGLDQPGSPDRAIISAAIVLGQSLGFTVVAEGVETETQLAILRELDCDVVQGHLLSHPAPPAIIGDRLADPRPWV